MSVLFPMPDEATLDCQDCGSVVKVLSESERQEVADNPYNFIVYCRDCRKARIEEFFD